MVSGERENLIFRDLFSREVPMKALPAMVLNGFIALAVGPLSIGIR